MTNSTLGADRPALSGVMAAVEARSSHDPEHDARVTDYTAIEAMEETPIAAPVRDDGAREAWQALSDAASPGEWGIWSEPVADYDEAKEEALRLVRESESPVGHMSMLAAEGRCPALTGWGPRSEANANFIAALVNGFRSGAIVLASLPSPASDVPGEAQTPSGDDEPDDLLWLRYQVLALCEDTEDKMHAELEKRGATQEEQGFYRGRYHEAKGIRRAIAEVVRCRLAKRAANPTPGEAQTQEGVSIRDGAFYRNALGEKIGPMHRIAGDAAQIWYANGQRGDWSQDGRALHAKPAENLVAEWNAPVSPGEAQTQEGGR